MLLTRAEYSVQLVNFGKQGKLCMIVCQSQFWNECPYAKVLLSLLSRLKLKEIYGLF